MKRRIPKTPASPIGDELRKTAIAYKADGQGERAEGIIDAANRIDAWLFAQGKAKPPLARTRWVDGDPEMNAESALIEGFIGAAGSAAGSLAARITALEENLGHLATLVAAGARKVEAPKAMPTILEPPASRPNGVHKASASMPKPLTERLSRAERKILTALAQMGGTASEEVLLLLTGYRYTGAWTEALASLRARGDLDGWRITPQGRSDLGTYVPLPRGEALVLHWERELGRCAGVILRYLLNNTDPGESRTEEEALEATEYKKTGSWTEALSALRKLHLLTPRGELRIPDEARLLLSEGS